ncbi:MAG: energy-coupling factor ABC transporter permease [Candidatus Hydrothermarchaeales archaeon]
MHISDGILSFKWIVVWYLVALIFMAVGLWDIQRRMKKNPAYMPMLAVMGAAVFVISIWHFPVPVTGSSSHPIGTPMAAILVGAFPTVVVSAIALFFHMFLAHGGLTTLGANLVSMGIVGAFSGLLVYKVLRRLNFSLPIAAGAAGFIGDIATYTMTSAELALSLAGEGSVVTLWGIFMLGFAPTQIVLAAVEFGFTAWTISYLSTRHDIFVLEKGEIVGQDN